MSRIVLFLGSTREGRNGERVGAHLVKLLKAKNNQVTVMDPLKMPFEMLKVPLHWMSDQSAAPQWLREADRNIREADGFVLVTPEYNCALPPALLNMMDHFAPAAFRHRPVGFACYSMGNGGGTRAAAFARAFVSELGMVSVPAQLVVPTVHKLYSPEGETEDQRVAKNANKMIDELQWYVEALKAPRSAGVPN